MIGRVLWDEFFENRDWPVASAVAICMLLLLVVPIMLFQRYQTPRAGRRAQVRSARQLFLARALLVLGFVFLYVPILSMIVFSFNNSRLVTVWGGDSPTLKWYGVLFHDRPDARGAPGCRSAHRGRHRHRRGRSWARWPGWCWRASARFRGRTLLAGMVHRAARHARSHHRACRCCCCSSRMEQLHRLAGGARLQHDRHRAHHVLHGLRHRGRAVAARRLGRVARGGRHGPGRAARRRYSCRITLPLIAAGDCSPAGCWRSRCRWTIW